MGLIKVIIVGTVILALLATVFLYYFNRIYGINRKRQKALDWWYALPEEQQSIIELDFFDTDCTGETTDIDIEAMYSIYGKHLDDSFKNVTAFNQDISGWDVSGK